MIFCVEGGIIKKQTISVKQNVKQNSRKRKKFHFMEEKYLQEMCFVL